MIVLFLTCVLSSERDEQLRLAPKYDAQMEVTLRDGTRVDLLNATHAIEIDYARKWAEGCTQALHYAHLTGKRPGLILLVTDKKSDWKAAVRAAFICGKYGITLYTEEIPH